MHSISKGIPLLGFPADVGERERKMSGGESGGTSRPDGFLGASYCDLVAERDMVVLAQLVEHRIVVPSVVGSSPTFHPRVAGSNPVTHPKEV